jgi:hypothetical protein
MGVNKFVFVVCGGKEHIDTLHFSLRYLQHFSRYEAVVVTDVSRNEIPVEHSHIINVQTPEHFTHHQASIYLKVGLNRFLPKGCSYCYLDTDVVAINSECDEIFEYKSGTVTFARDHCIMPKFSPNAVRCNCSIVNRREKAELEELMRKYDPANKPQDPLMEEKKRRLINEFELIKKDKFKYLLVVIRFLTTVKTFKLNDDMFYNRWKKLWHDAEGRVIIPPAENMFRDIEKNSDWRWDSLRKRWIGADGRDVFNPECNHLAEFIKSKFGIEVKNKKFHHWNGGVFLFDDTSDEFMNAWFNKTMEVFKDENWYTRDQGTLIATVWQFGLENAPVLPKKFNFIADYTTPRMMMNDKGDFTDDAFRTKVRPAFLHIYHNWGKRGWDIWEHVLNIGANFAHANECAG